MSSHFNDNNEENREIQKMNAELQRLETGKQVTKNQLVEVLRQIEQLKAVAQSHEVKIRRRDEQIKQLNAELERLKQDLEDLRDEQINQLNAELGRLKQDLEDLRDEHARLEQQRRDQQFKHDCLQDKLYQQTERLRELQEHLRELQEVKKSKLQTA